MKTESETRAYLRNIVTRNANIREKLMSLEWSNITMAKRLNKRLVRNYAKIKVLHCVLNG